ncbi:YigZ family protein [bacterium]|nr:YigZ family protein [bacterium]
MNVMAIVVRYFGGTLLGVGGLIQAYTQATKYAIANCNIVEKEILKEFELIHEYAQTSLVAHLMEKYDIKLINEVCDKKSKKVLSINQ